MNTLLRRALAAVTLPIVAVSGLAACGSDTDSDTPTVPTLSPESPSETDGESTEDG